MCIRTMRSFAHPWIFTHHDPRLHKSQSVAWIICWGSPQQYQLHSTNSLVAVCPFHPTPGPNLISQDYSTLLIVILVVVLAELILSSLASGVLYTTCTPIQDLVLHVVEFWTSVVALFFTSTLAAWTLIAFLLEMLKFSKLLFSKNKILWRKLKSPL